MALVGGVRMNLGFIRSQAAEVAKFADNPAVAPQFAAISDHLWQVMVAAIRHPDDDAAVRALI